ncbi:unnamed protein product, partial [Tetraodon nigroviridis]
QKCDLHRLEEGPPEKAELTREQGLQYYRTMQTIRRMELKADQLYKQKIIRGFCHLYDGQEACAAGIEAAITPSDHLITAYRAHGYTFTRGVSVKEILAELTGETGGTFPSSLVPQRLHRSLPPQVAEGAWPKAKGALCTCTRLISTEATASWELRFLWELELLWPASTRETSSCVSRCTATAQPIRASCLSPSTWLRCGSCRASLSARTTNTEWARLWSERPPAPTTTREETSSRGSDRPGRTETTTGKGAACPGSCRCEHPSSCLVLLYDAANKPEKLDSSSGSAVMAPSWPNGDPFPSSVDSTVPLCLTGGWDGCALCPRGHQVCRRTLQVWKRPHRHGAADLSLPRTQHERPGCQVIVLKHFCYRDDEAVSVKEADLQHQPVGSISQVCSSSFVTVCSYRTRDEIQEVRSKSDPISMLKDRMLGNNMASVEEFKEIDISIRKEVEEAAQFCTSDPEPPLEDLCNHIFCNNPPLGVRGTHPWAVLKSVS